MTENRSKLIQNQKMFGVLLAVAFIGFVGAFHIHGAACGVQRSRFTRKITEIPSDVSSKFRSQLSTRNEQEEAEFVDDELVKRVEAEVRQVSGVGLEGLMNPSTVLNLERDLIDLNLKLQVESDAKKKDEILKSILKKTDKLYMEKRMVFRGWLKNLFVGQSVLAGLVSLGMAYNSIPGQDLALPLQVLGFWMWWLFIIPSLRARKPGAAEKDALNIAFLITPVVSIIAPFATKDTGLLWWANAGAVALCYAYSFSKSDDLKNGGQDGEASSLPIFVKRAINALDYGSGKERGARN
jgi:hypothetical protein